MQLNELHIPVKLIGVGEKIEDLQKFDADSFVKALFENAGKKEDDEEVKIFSSEEDENYD